MAICQIKTYTDEGMISWNKSFRNLTDNQIEWLMDKAKEFEHLNLDLKGSPVGDFERIGDPGGE